MQTDLGLSNADSDLGLSNTDSDLGLSNADSDLGLSNIYLNTNSCLKCPFNMRSY